jgi:hypothetical protein
MADGNRVSEHAVGVVERLNGPSFLLGATPA